MGKKMFETTGPANSFDNLDARRRKAREATDRTKKAEETRESQRLIWNHQNVSRSPGGTTLDPLTAEARAASEAARTAKSPVPKSKIPTKAELATRRAAALADAKNPGHALREQIKNLVLTFLQTTLQGQRLLAHNLCVDANAQTLYNGMLYAESLGHTLDLNTVIRVYEAAVRDHNIFLNRHIGQQEGHLILQEGEPRPTVFEWQSPQEKSDASIAAFNADVSEVKKMSDEELRRHVLAQRKSKRAGAPGHGGIL